MVYVTPVKKLFKPQRDHNPLVENCCATGTGNMARTQLPFKAVSIILPLIGPELDHMC